MGGSRLERLWYGEEHSTPERLLASILAPLSWAYRLGLGLTVRSRTGSSVDRPVVSIGNLTVGGSGKTPLLIELVRLFSDKGWQIAIVSRGYRRVTRGTRVVYRPGGLRPSASEAGDEPALLALRCPNAGLVVGEDRLEAARLAIRSFAPDLVICDDAFQHVRLKRDVNILAVHARRGFGNRRLLPWGPLREPTTAMARASLVVFTHAGAEDLVSLRRRHGIPDRTRAAACRFVPAGFVRQTNLVFSERLLEQGPVLVACGIANADGFLATCREAGLTVAGQRFFPDHHRFTRRDLLELEKRAAGCRASAIVVTEKDLVRLADERFSLPVFGLRIQAVWIDRAGAELLTSLVAEAIGNGRPALRVS